MGKLGVNYENPCFIGFLSYFLLIYRVVDVGLTLGLGGAIMETHGEDVDKSGDKY